MADTKTLDVQSGVSEERYNEKSKVTVQEQSEDDSNGHLQPMLHGQPQLLPGASPTIQWEADPRHLQEDPRWELFFDVYDSFLIVITLVLLAKTSLCIYAFKKDKDSRGLYLDTVSMLTLNLIRFNEQLVTAFTIIFVTIMTTVTRRYALYKAQKGAYIADIEQLQASISLPSTIKMVFSLQRFTKVSVILVVLWSFYYTGSQASKREYALAVSDSVHPMEALYPRSDALFFVDPDSRNWPAGSSSDLGTIFKKWNNNKKTTNGADDDGNILLPDPNFGSAGVSLYANGTVENPNIIKLIPSTTVYLTPAVGRPLYVYADADSNGTKQWSSQRIIGDYQLNTSYTKFHCLSVDVLPASQFPAGALDTMAVSINMTESSSQLPQAAKQVQVWRRWSSNDTFIGTVEPYDIIPTPKINGTDGGVIRVTCDIIEPQVIVNVHCGDAACIVTQMLLPQISNGSLQQTVFSNATFAESFFSSMLLSDGVPERRNESATATIASMLSMDDAISQIVNGALNKDAQEGILSFEATWLDSVVNAYINLMLRASAKTYYFGTPPAFDKVTVKGAPWDPHYQIFWEWIAIDYVAGACLLGAAIVSFWLRKNTIAPDIFGFVSSLTRDNPNFPVPVGGSTLDGISRTRAFRNVKVKLGDIGGTEDGHGRLGFVPIVPTIPAQPLSRLRKYI